jgi:hypothetical protein
MSPSASCCRSRLVSRATYIFERVIQAVSKATSAFNRVTAVSSLKRAPAQQAIRRLPRQTGSWCRAVVMICPALLGLSRVAHAEDPVQRASGLSQIAERLRSNVPPSGFVPIRAAWLTLGLKPATSARLDLIRLAAISRAAETQAQSQPVTDQSDRNQNIHPEDDERRREETHPAARAPVALALAEDSNRDPALPVAGEQPERRVNTRDQTELAPSPVNYIPVLRLSGIALVGVGLITALVSHGAYDPSTCTKKEYETMKLWNDLGWASVALGGGAFGASFVLKPPNLRSTTIADFAVPGPARAAFVQVRGTY